MPVSTSNTPGIVVPGLKNNKSKMIAPANAIYKAGKNGYPNALYGLSASGLFLRKMKIP
jgi:hypothetical protein